MHRHRHAFKRMNERALCVRPFSVGLTLSPESVVYLQFFCCFHRYFAYLHEGTTTSLNQREGKKRTQPTIDGEERTREERWRGREKIIIENRKVFRSIFSLLHTQKTTTRTTTMTTNDNPKERKKHRTTSLNEKNDEKENTADGMCSNNNNNSSQIYQEEKRIERREWCEHVWDWVGKKREIKIISDSVPVIHVVQIQYPKTVTIKIIHIRQTVSGVARHHTNTIRSTTARLYSLYTKPIKYNEKCSNTITRWSEIQWNKQKNERKMSGDSTEGERQRRGKGERARTAI